MSITRAQLRLAVAQGLNMAQTGVCTSAGATTMLDALTEDRKREAADFWNGSTLYLSAGTGGPGSELLDESAGVETETNGAVVTLTNTAGAIDATDIKIATSSTAGSTGNFAIATGTTTITAARDYLFTGWAKGDGTNSPRFQAKVTGGADILPLQSVNVTSPYYTRVQFVIRAPAACTNITVYLHGTSALSSTVYWDAPHLRLLGQSKYITDWDPSTGTFTTGTWTTQPVAGTNYEVYFKTFTLTDYDRAINDAIRKGARLWALKYDTSITTVANTYAYDIPANVTLPLVNVEVQNNTTHATAPYTEMAFWSYLNNGDTRKIQFRDALSAGYTVRLTYTAPLDTLDTDFDELDDLYRPYVESKAKASLYRIFLGKLSRADRVQAGENTMNFDEEAEIELRKIPRQYPATRVRMSGSPWAH